MAYLYSYCKMMLMDSELTYESSTRDPVQPHGLALEAENIKMKF